MPLLECPALSAVDFRTLLLPHVVNLVGLGREFSLKVGLDVVLQSLITSYIRVIREDKPDKTGQVIFLCAA